MCPSLQRKANWQCLFRNDKIQVFKQKLEFWKLYIHNSELHCFPILRTLFWWDVGGWWWLFILYHEQCVKYLTQWTNIFQVINICYKITHRLESHSKCKIYQGTLTKSPLILILPASLLSHFSCVRPCATPQTAAPQAPPSLGLAISFSNAWKWKVKVRSLSRIRLLAIPWTAAYQATSVHSIFQARVLPGVGCHCLLRILILLCT